MAVTPTLTNLRSKAARQWVVRLGSEAGAAPTETDETQLLKNPIVKLGCNSQQMDSCELTYDLSVNAERLQDSFLKAGLARQVEIVQVNPEPGKPPKLIYWGELTSERKGVSPDGESITYTATIEPYHFGNPIAGPHYRRPTGAHDEVILPGDLVFNPEVDNQVEYNRSSNLFDADSTHNAYYWINPDSVRTAAARTFTGDQGNEWTLEEIVCALIWYGNPDETYITNPLFEDVHEALQNAPEVKNLRLPPGRYLSDYLDMVLNPYGYAWCMTYKYDENEARVVSYRFFKLGDGETIKLYQQKPGDSAGAKHTLSSVVDWEVETDIGNVPNKIKVNGDYVRREMTIELYRAWPEADDALTAAGLTQSTGADYDAHQSAWRLWVANEGGDYCSLRTVTAPIPATATSFATELGASTIPKRRKPMDCLTHYDDDASGEARRRRPPFIQWYNASNQWKPLPNGWGETVLTDQIGVYFAGDSPPAALIARGANARLRITCTVEGDTPLTATAARQSDSINQRTREVTVEAGDRFIDQQIQTSGSYISVLAGVPSSEERDDTADITAFAEKIRQSEDLAAMRAKVTILGLNSQYKIGKCVSEIYGRNISLNRKADTATTKKYMQIMSVTYDHQQQSTVLIVEPINETVVIDG